MYIIYGDIHMYNYVAYIRTHFRHVEYSLLQGYRKFEINIPNTFLAERLTLTYFHRRAVYHPMTHIS